MDFPIHPGFFGAGRWPSKVFSLSLFLSSALKPRQRALCLMLALTCASLVILQPVAYATYLTEWYGTVPVLGYSVSNYPSSVAALSCIAGGARVFCIGGLNSTSQTTNSTYAAPLTTLGTGGWAKLPDYPTGIAGQSCMVYSGYVYCVGGLQVAATGSTGSQITSAVYFAALTPSGMGAWTRTTDYPFDVYDQSCAVIQGYVYCVGGVSSNSREVSAVEYAPLSPSGITRWMTATSYPTVVAAESCAGYAASLYCVGGLNATSIAVSTVYHGSPNGSELSWVGGADYPTPVAGQSCLVQYPGLYCIGGLNSTSYATRSVYFSYLNDTQLNWIGSAAYPVDVQGQSCVAYSSQIYCIGGYNGTEFIGSVYFSSIGPMQVTPVEATSSTKVATSAIEAGASSTNTSSYALAMDLVLAGTAIASVAIIAFLGPDKRGTAR